MEKEYLTEKECNSFLDKMFPQGFTGQDVKDEIIPNGWEHSALKAVFHPSVEQAYEEYVQREYNIRKVFKKKKKIMINPYFGKTLTNLKRTFKIHSAILRGSCGS